METSDNTRKSDITQEPYKGPGALVTGAGEGAITHYGTGFAGLIGGSVIGYAAPKAVHKVEDAFVNFQKNTESSIAPVRWLGKAAGKVREWSREAGEKLARSKLLRNAAQHSSVSGRMEAMIFGGGLLAFIGFFVVPIYFMFTGARHSRGGREQFERAKDEIITTRAERDTLRDKYVETQIKLDELQSKQKENVSPKVSAETPGVFGDEALKDSPNVITAPRIEAPTISTNLPQAPKIEGPPVQGPSPQSPIPRNQWWDGKEQPLNKVAADEAVAERVQAHETEASQEAARV